MVDPHRSKGEEGGAARWISFQSRSGSAVGAASRPLLTALSGSRGGFGTNTSRGGKQGGRLAPTWAACSTLGAGAPVDVGGLAIGTGARAGSARLCPPRFSGGLTATKQS